jgi:hypothetical protein
MPQSNHECVGHEDIFPHQLTEMGKKYVDAVMNVQVGLLDELRQANAELIASAQSRLALASDPHGSPLPAGCGGGLSGMDTATGGLAG